MNFLDWCQPAFLEALLTQRVGRCVPVTDALPSPAVFAVDVRAALVLVVAVPVQLLMLRTEASVGEPWAAGISENGRNKKHRPQAKPAGDLFRS